MNSKRAVIDHVEPQNTIIFKNLLKLLEGHENRLPKNIDKWTNFINLSGFFDLIHGSHKPCPYNHALHDFRARLGYDKSQCDLSIPHLVLELTMHVMHS